MKETSPDIGALGKEDNDYFVMWDLFRRLLRRIVAIDADPTAFLSLDGRHDMIRLNTWAGMIDKARSALSDLNKMRNSDKLTMNILEQHTLSFSKTVASGLGDEVRVIIDELRSNSDPQFHAVADRIQDIVSERVPLLFASAGEQALEAIKKRYKLLH
jgi:hypothetical protein